MPDAGTRKRGNRAVRWRTVKLRDGRTIQVAIVRKTGAAGPAHATKGK